MDVSRDSLADRIRALTGRPDQGGLGAPDGAVSAGRQWWKNAGDPYYILCHRYDEQNGVELLYANDMWRQNFRRRYAIKGEYDAFKKSLGTYSFPLTDPSQRKRVYGGAYGPPFTVSADGEWATLIGFPSPLMGQGASQA